MQRLRTDWLDVLRGDCQVVNDPNGQLEIVLDKQVDRKAAKEESDAHVTWVAPVVTFTTMVDASADHASACGCHVNAGSSRISSVRI